MANLPSYTSLVAAMNALERGVSDFEYGLASTTVQRASADGKVSVVADSMGRIVSVTIDASLVTPGDPAGLASRVIAAANQAIGAAVGSAASAAVAFAQGLGLPGLPAYGGAAPDYPGFGATAALVRSTALANNPCHKPRTFPCRVGPVTVTLDAERKLVGLVYDTPLTENIAELESSTVAAINCAVGKANNPPEDVTDAVGGITGTNVTYENLALYANDCIQIDHGSVIRGLGGEGYGMLGNAGTGPVMITHAVHTGSIASRGSVRVQFKAEVHGSIRTEGSVTVEPFGQVHGPITENAAVVLPILRVGVVFPGTVQNGIVVWPATTASAAPAYYRSINLWAAATLNLSSGVYYTDSLSLDVGSRIVANATHGPVILWVKNSLTYRGCFQDSAGGFPRIWIGYVGTQDVWLVAPFKGSIVAPNAKLMITGGVHEGSFHAKTLHVAHSQTICHRPFELPFNQVPGARPPEPPPVPVAPQTQAVLSFAEANAWTSTKASLALVTTPVTEGSQALRVSSIAFGPAPVVSRVFASAGLYAPSGRLSIDVHVPKAQGTIDITARIPSAGINIAVSFGPKSLGGLQIGRYHTLIYTLPTNVANAIADRAADVTLSVVFNVPLNTGTFHLDNLRFS